MRPTTALAYDTRSDDKHDTGWAVNRQTSSLHRPVRFLHSGRSMLGDT